MHAYKRATDLSPKVRDAIFERSKTKEAIFTRVKIKSMKAGAKLAQLGIADQDFIVEKGQDLCMHHESVRWSYNRATKLSPKIKEALARANIKPSIVA